jgi:acyl-CoA reductase-like NAD-dependent aldehyde dehydrogenase
MSAIDTGTIQTVDPATGQTVASYDITSDTELDAILDRSVAAFAGWRRTPIDTRAQALLAIAGHLAHGREEYAQLITLEMGKPIAEARAEIDKCKWVCEHYAREGAGLLAAIDVATDASASYVQFAPLGPVLAIMPWNYPFWQVLRFAAPALMAGNPVVLKHASNVTGSSLALAELAARASLPDGLLQSVVVPGTSTDRLIADRRIAAVTLTGSDAVGAQVGALCGRHLKKAVLELGGSDAFVVLADADVERAAHVAVRARFQNAGQSCIAAKRFIVVDAVADRFEEAFAAGASALVVGDPQDEATDMGPMARADLRDELAGMIDAGLAAGGRLLTGGGVPDRSGAFLEPTVIAGVAPGTGLFDRETFGPVAAVTRVADTGAAIAAANDSSFGLSFSIWTEDVDAARAMSPLVEAGGIFINAMSASDPRMPFGGVKRSGYGRELGSFGIREFVNVQGITVA